MQCIFIYFEPCTFYCYPLVINIFFFVTINFIPFLESGLPLFPFDAFLFCTVKFYDQEKKNQVNGFILIGAFGKLDLKNVVGARLYSDHHVDCDCVLFNIVSCLIASE